MTDAPTTQLGASLRRAHLVGVGGAGMSGIARILADRGFAVSGSDARDSAVLAGLAARGVRTAVGHAAANLELLPGGPTAVVVSTAVRPDNPEVLAARAAGIPVVRRADALAALMTGRRSVCVAGTHGKTSTTSMLTVALQEAGLDPSFAIGGELTGSGLGAHHGRGDVFVAEADESDGSFLSFGPHGAVITNLEPDHLDHHGTAAAYTAVFDQFVDRIEPGGFLVVCADDPGTAALADRVALRRVIRYGRSTAATVRLAGDTVVLADGREVPLRLTVPGEHMLLNATAALAAGVELGVDPEPLARGLAGYTGVRRRFERKGTAGGVVVYDDYAHHPTEVAAQLGAARGVAGDGRLVVVFQPHLYSRTATFAAEFGTALATADLVVVLDVYGAREDPQPGVTGELVAAAVRDRTAVLYHPDRASAADAVAGLLRPGDLVITMGAGDVTAIGPQLLARLAGPGGDPEGAAPA
ncbi:UDP-N-acetylmuramate--L-alanine ligase [Nakamurella sp.]|uniref:UDP-N-acetylmuramate--L-alanine ligase n=1 Tax=Nakamurella sp. TaxID=1869182 RepID=UPI003B3BC93E